MLPALYCGYRIQVRELIKESEHSKIQIMKHHALSLCDYNCVIVLINGTSEIHPCVA